MLAPSTSASQGALLALSMLEVEPVGAMGLTRGLELAGMMLIVLVLLRVASSATLLALVLIVLLLLSLFAVAEVVVALVLLFPSVPFAVIAGMVASVLVSAVGGALAVLSQRHMAPGRLSVQGRTEA